MGIFWKKTEAASEAETRQRQEVLMLRIADNGGVEKLDTLELRDIPEAITLCQLLNRSMENNSMKCLENFLRGLGGVK